MRHAGRDTAVRSHTACEVWVMRITHEPSLRGVATEERPDVFISGALHGDERIGPVSSLETARLLVRAESCVERLELASVTAARCVELGEISVSERRALESGGDELLGTERLLWLARLVRRRSM